MIKIIIDPGHYDDPNTYHIEDPGAVVGKLIEQKLNIKVVKELKKILKDYDVRYVADNLRLKFVIQWIKDIINPTDLAIAIHFNSSKYKEARGTECYYATKGQKGIAQIMSDSVSKRLGVPNRGPRHDSMTYVGSLGFLRLFNAQSVLLECCYLTNLMDKIAIENDGVHKIALGIKDGIDRISKIQNIKKQISLYEKLVELWKRVLALKIKLKK